VPLDLDRVHQAHFTNRSAGECRAATLPIAAHYHPMA
jgi:hypothetical protein